MILFDKHRMSRQAPMVRKLRFILREISIYRLLLRHEGSFRAAKRSLSVRTTAIRRVSPWRISHPSRRTVTRSISAEEQLQPRSIYEKPRSRSISTVSNEWHIAMSISALCSPMACWNLNESVMVVCVASNQQVGSIVAVLCIALIGGGNWYPLFVM